MILLAGLLVLAAVALLVIGLAQGSPTLQWASFAASALAAVVVMGGEVRRRLTDRGGAQQPAGELTPAEAGDRPSVGRHGERRVSPADSRPDEPPSYDPLSYAPPNHQAPSYRPPSHEVPTYQPPTYQPPTYEAPAHEPAAPEPWTHGSSAYQPPTYEAPSYQPPTHEALNHEAPNDEGPTYEPPAHEPAAPEPWTHGSSAYQPPTYEAPTYQPPTYGAPSYEPSTYEPSTYEPPTYEPPTYEPPTSVPPPAPSVGDRTAMVPAAAAGLPPAGGADGEPPIEEVEVTDLLVVLDLVDEVLVVDEHPRYHLAGCPHLTGQETFAMPMVEARTDGFSPCGTCAPDRNLARVERARRSRG